MAERDLTKRWGVTDDCARCSYVPDGWMGMLDRLMLALADIPGWDPTYASQIKTKFGDLRFYYWLPPESDELLQANIKALIEQFEEEASATCARCGSSDGVKTTADQSSWIRTECDACRAPLV